MQDSPRFTVAHSGDQFLIRDSTTGSDIKLSSKDALWLVDDIVTHLEILEDEQASRPKKPEEQ